MWLGIRALNFSANEALESEDGKKEEIGPLAMAGTMIVALAFSLGLFLALPLLLTNLLGAQYAAVNRHSILFNLTDGAFRVALFLGYVSGISFMKDIRRVFEYHGAEHKAIAAYEAGRGAHGGERQALLPHSPALRHQLFADRGRALHCPVLAHSRLLAPLGKSGFADRAASGDRRPGVRVHQVQRETVRQPADRKLMQPGLWLQRLTTREPSDDQIEVAITAMR